MKGSLVLYKEQPAIVISAGERIEIELAGGKTQKVRHKDVLPLHPGPIKALGELTSCEGDLQTAWEMLAGETTDLSELAELAFNEFTPTTAWAAWESVADGLYFEGKPEEIRARTESEVAAERARREAREQERESWEEFKQRIEAGSIAPGDKHYLEEVEALAIGQSKSSRLLKELASAETAENGHALLLRVGHWDVSNNPYPAREGINMEVAKAELPPLPEEERLDLTHLASFAIDDEGSTDPDDALSLDGDTLWVHVADVAALVRPDFATDLEARSRASNLYLPEQIVHMLPESATAQLGLGLNEVSPALSFRISLSENAQAKEVEVHRSLVRVQRLTYEEAETRLTQSPFDELANLADRSFERRKQNGAVEISLPEVRVQVEDGEVTITPLPAHKSRSLVMEAMLIAGEAVAKYAAENEIPLPFSTQEPPAMEERPSDTAGMFALRRSLRRSQLRSVPSSNSGLGLEAYVQATSPLRRYLDLVVHQQVRAHLSDEPMIPAQDLLERVGAAEALASELRRAERNSRQHWTLVHLQQKQEWRGKGIVVGRRRQQVITLLPEIGMEARIYANEDLDLNSEVEVALDSVDLPNLLAHFKIL
ncbi:MAG: RNB domain-containing ribonuclease [Planctomycetota bacterium]|jgi:exoribonuclease-2|nr:RNB domain-containing ribonuclease [Planctomycetota bacterium]